MVRHSHPVEKDALDYLYQKFIEGNPMALAQLQCDRTNAHIARQVYDLRTKAGLTQAQLAKLVGTAASVICQLEDADYKGRTLQLLQRVAAALKRTVEVRLVPRKSGTR